MVTAAIVRLRFVLFSLGLLSNVQSGELSLGLTRSAWALHGKGPAAPGPLRSLLSAGEPVLPAWAAQLSSSDTPRPGASVRRIGAQAGDVPA